MYSKEERKRVLYVKKVSQVQKELTKLKQDLMDAFYLSETLRDTSIFTEITEDSTYDLLCELYFRVPGQRAEVSEAIKEQVAKIESGSQDGKVKTLGLGRPITIMPERN